MTTATPEEFALISKIADRAALYYRRYAGLPDLTRRSWARSAIADEILTVHEEIMPLRLGDLLDAPLSDFLYDIAGIHTHFSGGNPPFLKDHFVPHCAARDRRWRN